MKRSFNKIGAAFLSFITFGMMGNGAVNSTGKVRANNYDVIHNKPHLIKAQADRKIFNDPPNPYKHIRTPKSNQRQKRKWARQVPNIRRSKKNPLK